MATNLSAYFRAERQRRGLRLADMAQRMGHPSGTRAAKKIFKFEERGDVSFTLFTKLATALDIDEGTIQRLMEEDRRALVQEWNQWASRPITPHLIVRLAPWFFMGHRLPDDAVTPEEMEGYASDLAQRTQNMVWLVLSRRLSVGFDEAGAKRTVSEATPFEPSEPYTWLGGLKRRFLPTCDGGRIELDGLDAPRERGPKKPPPIDSLLDYEVPWATRFEVASDEGMAGNHAQPPAVKRGEP